MALPVSYIGALVQMVASVPATTDASGFGALTYTTIGKIVSVDPTGDTTDNISIPLLAGRVEHVNGAADGGEIPMAFRWDGGTDAGQTLILANNNGSQNCSFKITDPDGKIEYFFALIANYQSMARNTQNYKGYNFVARVNSPVIRV
jgi:hypothetical protein